MFTTEILRITLDFEVTEFEFMWFYCIAPATAANQALDKPDN